MSKKQSTSLNEISRLMSDRLKINIQRDPYQQKYVKALLADPSEVQAVFVDAAAGTGKTSLAISVAYQLLQTDQIDQIVYVKNTATIRELGFLPGDLAEKEAPYMQPGLDALSRMEAQNPKLIETLINNEKLVITTTAFLRGIDWDKRKFIIVDEAQNMTLEEMQMILTRPHDSTKIIVIGSSLQCDETQKEYGKDKLNAFQLYTYHYIKHTDLNVLDIKLKNNYRGKFSLMADKIKETIAHLEDHSIADAVPYTVKTECTKAQEADLWEELRDEVYRK